MVTITDTFESLADGAALSTDTDWDVTIDSGSGVPTMDQHDDHSDLSQVVDMSTVGDAYAIHQTQVGENDHYAECDVFPDKGTTHFNRQGPIVRGSAATHSVTFDGYGAFARANDDDVGGGLERLYYGIYRIDNGVPTLLTETANLGLGGTDEYDGLTDHMLRLEVVGSTLTLYVDGVQELSTTDSTYSAGQYVGFRHYREEASGDSQPFVDNFTAEEILSSDFIAQTLPAFSQSADGEFTAPSGTPTMPSIRSSAVSVDSSLFDSLTHDYDLPATVSAGDLLVVVACLSATDPASGPFPAGWTQHAAYNDTTADDVHIIVGRKVADGTEGGGTVTLTYETNATAGVVFAFALQDGDNAAGVSATAYDTNAASLTVTGPTTTSVNNLAFAVVHNDNDNEDPLGYPTGWTGQLRSGTGIGGSTGTAAGIATKEIVAAGSTGDADFTSLGFRNTSGLIFTVEGVISGGAEIAQTLPAFSQSASGTSSAPGVEYVTATSGMLSDLTQITVTMPSPAPDGDLYLAFLTSDDEALANPLSGDYVTVPAGWTLLFAQQDAPNNNTGSLVCAYRIGDSEPTTYDFGGNSLGGAWSVVQITGVGSSPINVDAVDAAVTADATAPTATTTVDETLVVRSFFSDGAAFDTTPSTTRVNQQGDGSNYLVVSTEAGPATAGATGTATATRAVADEWIAATLAVSPPTDNRSATVAQTLQPVTQSAVSTNTPKALLDFIAVAHLVFDMNEEAYADGNSITTLTDQTTNSRDASASNPATPTKQTVAGTPVARFDGADDIMTTGTWTGLSTVTYVVLAKADDADTNDRFLMQGLTASTRNVLKTDTGQFGIFAGNTTINAGTDDSDWHVFIAVFDGASSEIYIDGGTPAGTGNAGTEQLTGLSLGGQSYDGTRFWDGDVNYAAIYAGDLVADDVTLLNELASVLAARQSVTWANVGNTFTASAAQTLPAFSTDATGTHTPPAFTADVDQTLPAVSQDASGSHTAPVFSADAAQALQPVSQDATGTHTSPVFEGSAAQTLAAVTQDATGTHVAPVFEGTADQSLQAITTDATGTVDPPVAGGTIDQTLAPVSQDATGTYVPPSRTGTAEQTLQPVSQDASGTHVAPVFVGGATQDLQSVSQDATGTHTPPGRSGDAAQTLQPVSQAAVARTIFTPPNIPTIDSPLESAIVSTPVAIEIGYSDTDLDSLARISIRRRTSPSGPPIPTADSSTWWADDLALADGAGVGTWAAREDALGYGDLEQSTPANRPLLTASNANLNGRASVDGNGVARTLHSANAPSPSVSQPLTIVTIGYNSVSGGTQSGPGHGFYTNPRAIFRNNSDDKIYAGTVLAAGAASLTRSIWISRFNGALSSIEVNGTTTGSGNAGTAGAASPLSTHCTGAPDFNSPTQHSSLQLAFVQVIDGDLTTSEANAVKAWAEAIYDVTLA